MTGRNSQDVEVVGVERRRRWTAAEKLAMVRETYEPGMSVSLVARRHGVNANQVFAWRKLERAGALTAVGTGEAVVPAGELEAARRQIREPLAAARKKDDGGRNPQGSGRLRPDKKVACALARQSSALTTRGRPMKTVCDVLGVARSNIHDRLCRPANWRDRRCGKRPSDDAELVADIQAAIEHLPSYGYRRAAALVNRRRLAEGRPLANHKRTWRVMREHHLLLQRHSGRPPDTRCHDGRIAVEHSNVRWCSDGFEIGCDSGERVRVAFALDSAATARP